MGGFGSGRRGGRPKTEQMKRLDLVSLRRKGYLSGFPMCIGWSCGDTPTGNIGLQALTDGLRLFYSTRTHDGEWQAVNEVVPFVWMPMQFGGRRQWFRCPKCARTCRILYGGSRFRCRRCYRLSYS